VIYEFLAVCADNVTIIRWQLPLITITYGSNAVMHARYLHNITEIKRQYTTRKWVSAGGRSIGMTGANDICSTQHQLNTIIDTRSSAWFLQVLQLRHSL